MKEQLTIRDQFALSALQGLIAMSNNDEFDCEFADALANWAYDFADAMMKRRKRPKENKL